tara:strand:+ start:329 stop:544 length:216 start_codon:yes stop_codon:yes gene_type:complete
MRICNFQPGDLVRCRWSRDIGVVQQIAPIDETHLGWRADKLLIQWTTDYEKFRGFYGKMRHYVDSKFVKKV